jgi:hypothetical protein
MLRKNGPSPTFSNQKHFQAETGRKPADTICKGFPDISCAWEGLE